jgi:hypothetical protein
MFAEEAGDFRAIYGDRRKSRSSASSWGFISSEEVLGFRWIPAVAVRSIGDGVGDGWCHGVGVEAPRGGSVEGWDWCMVGKCGCWVG